MTTFPITRRNALALAVSACLITTAQAETAPMRVILPLGPGSGVDVIVRSAQAALSKALNDQPLSLIHISEPTRH